MKKRLALKCFALFVGIQISSQDTDNSVSSILVDQANPPEEMEVTYEISSPSDKKDLGDKPPVGVFFDTRARFNVDEFDKSAESAFKVDQLRIEVAGNVTDKMYIRYRQNLSKTPDKTTLEGVASAIDYIYATYEFSDKLSLTGGKMHQSLGGMESDPNGIFVFQYSDFYGNIKPFHVGARLSYTPIDGHEFIVEATDSSADKLVSGSEESPTVANKNPFTYVVAWNGSLFDNLLQTKWGGGIITQAKDKYAKVLTIGNRLNLEKVQLDFDYSFADEDLDHFNTEEDLLVPPALVGKIALEKIRRNSFVVNVNYQPFPKWNTVVKGIYENASLRKVENFDHNPKESYGYSGAVEYLPFEDGDFRLFLAYTGRKYQYNNALSANNKETNQISLGCIYRIKAF